MPTKTRNNTTFINWINRKYKKELNYPANVTKFYYWDDYAIWLYFEKFNQDDDKYYEALEQDIKEFCDWQTGKEIDKDE